MLFCQIQKEDVMLSYLRFAKKPLIGLVGLLFLIIGLGVGQTSAQERLVFNSTGGGAFDIIGENSQVKYGTVETNLLVVGGSFNTDPFSSNSSGTNGYDAYPSFFEFLTDASSAPTMGQTLSGAAQRSYTFQFAGTEEISNLGLRLHILNLENSRWEWNYVGFNEVSSNPEMTLEATGGQTIFDRASGIPLNPGCERTDGSNQNGGCGSFDFSPAGQTISTLNIGRNGGSDGWVFTLESPATIGIEGEKTVSLTTDTGPTGLSVGDEVT